MHAWMPSCGFLSHSVEGQSVDTWVQVLALQVTGRAYLRLHICRVGESFLPVPLGSCRDSSKEEDGGALWLGL